MTMIPLFFVQCKNSKKAKQENVGNKDTTELTTNDKVKREKPKLIHDDKGNIIERHAYSYRKKDGSIRSKDSYYYKRDERGNVTEEIKESYSPDKELKFNDILVRTFCRYIPFEAFTFLGNKSPIGWHDKLSKTIVVSK